MERKVLEISFHLLKDRGREDLSVEFATGTFGEEAAFNCGKLFHNSVDTFSITLFTIAWLIITPVLSSVSKQTLNGLFSL